MNPEWTISVVSHGHGPALHGVLGDCQRLLDPDRFELVLTLNVPEPLDEAALPWRGPLRVIRNRRPKGFGANHNAALREARGSRVALLDPDLRLDGNPFEYLAEALDDSRVGIAATRVRHPDGAVADHARLLPRPLQLLRRHLRGEGLLYGHALAAPIAVDWIAGLFMALRRERFFELGGFDERYRLYCEDVDLCLRAWHRGWRVEVVPADWAMHPPRRRSRRDLRHFYWHCRGLMRLWRSPAYRDFHAAAVSGVVR